MKFKINTFIFSMTLLLIPFLPAVAHEGHQHTVMGTVTQIDDHHIEVKAKDGSAVSIMLLPETEFQKGDNPAALADVKVGKKVVVIYSEHEGHKMAHQVRLPAEKKSLPK